MKVIFLHGMGGSSRDADFLQAHLSVSAPKLPQEGNFDGAALKLARILGEETAPFVVCGYSLGGRLAIRAASLNPNPNWRGLILLGAGLGFNLPAEREARRKQDQFWAAKAKKTPGIFWQEWYQQSLFSSFAALPEALKSRWLEARLLLDPQALQTQLLEYSPANHEHLLPELLALQKRGMALLYVAGERDSKYCQQARELADLGIETMLAPGGHSLPIESPEWLAACVKNFVRELPEGK